MIKPMIALAALTAAIATTPRQAEAQQAGICQTAPIGCSSGPQLCATLEMEIDMNGVKVAVTKYCYQPG